MGQGRTWRKVLMCEFVRTRGPGRISKVHRKRAIDTNVGTELFVRVKLGLRCLGDLSWVKDVLIVGFWLIKCCF